MFYYTRQMELKLHQVELYNYIYLFFFSIGLQFLTHSVQYFTDEHE